MTTTNWISIGIAAAFIMIYAVLKIYVKRKTDQYDGLGGIITRRKKPEDKPDAEQNTPGNDA